MAHCKNPRKESLLSQNKTTWAVIGVCHVTYFFRYCHFWSFQDGGLTTVERLHFQRQTRVSCYIDSLWMCNRSRFAFLTSTGCINVVDIRRLTGVCRRRGGLNMLAHTLTYTHRLWLQKQRTAYLVRFLVCLLSAKNAVSVGSSVDFETDTHTELRRT